MSSKIEYNFSHTTPEGKTLIAAQDLTPETRMTFTCDGPKCSSTPISFLQEDVQKDSNALPDDFFRIMELRYFDDAKREFVNVGFHCQQCLRDWLKSYVAPRSPSEMARTMQNNEEVEKSKTEEPQQ